jgi:glycosyltransferase involved in cell wall biosynthesis
MVLGLRGFPNVQGGVERHAEQLYPLLAQLGCRVDVIIRSPYVPRELRVWSGVTFHHIWAPRTKGLEALIHSFIGVIYAGIRRPDILHIHAVGPAIVVPLGRALGLRVVVTHHGPDYDREKWGKPARWLLRLGERWGMVCANQRIVISGVIKKLVFDKYRLDSVVIPNGVDIPEIPKTKRALERFSLAAGRYILLVSRFVPEKRHLDLIEAFATAGLQDWKLVLVGGVDRRDNYCMSVLAAAGRIPGVVITDFQSGLALQELYAHAGIFVLPSSHEGLPIALLEALSYGLSVLASNIPANLEVGLPEANYFPLGSVTVLAEALRRQAVRQSDEVQREKLRAWVGGRYCWPKLAQYTLEIYKNVLKKKSEASL